jgi:hypothetical protein
VTNIVERLNDFEERLSRIEERLELAGFGELQPIDLGISQEDLFSLTDDLRREHDTIRSDNVVDFPPQENDRG